MRPPFRPRNRCRRALKLDSMGRRIKRWKRQSLCAAWRRRTSAFLVTAGPVVLQRGPRSVFETPDGRQNVVDDDGEFVFGVWYMPGEISREEWDALFADRLIIVEPEFRCEISG